MQRLNQQMTNEMYISARRVNSGTEPHQVCLECTEIEYVNNLSALEYAKRDLDEILCSIVKGDRPYHRDNTARLSREAYIAARQEGKGLAMTIQTLTALQSSYRKRMFCNLLSSHMRDQPATEKTGQEQRQYKHMHSHALILYMQM